MLKTTFVSLLFAISLLCAKEPEAKLLYDVDNEGKMDKSTEWIVEMVREAGKTHGIDVKFEGVVWSRGLDLVKQGLADGIINASYKTDRAEYAIYPMKDGAPDVARSLKAPAYMLYTLKDSTIEFDGKALKNVGGKIGAIESYAVVDDLKSLGADIKFGQNEAVNLQSVLHKEIVASAGSEAVADDIISKESELKKSIKKIPTPIRKKEYYLIFSKPYYEKEKSSAEKIWSGIEELKKSPKYQKHLQEQP